MCTGAYVAVAVSRVTTILHVCHVGLEGSAWLSKLPEHLMAHARPWNREMPAIGEARHFAQVLGDGNY